MTRLHPRETYAQLQAQIEKNLTPDGVTVRDLSATLDVGQSVVRQRLIELEEAGRAHHISMDELGRPGAAHVWVPGPAPRSTHEERLRIQAARRERAARLLRASTDQRDPLVAALFGSGPGRSAS
jgi:hypothetical protein